MKSPWKITAWIVAVYLALVGGGLVYGRLTAGQSDPWKSPALLALKARLETAPKDEALKKEIRGMDARLRERFRYRLWLDKSGAWLLLAGALALVVASRKAMKEVGEIKFETAKERSIWPVAASGLLVAVALAGVSIGLAPRGEAAAPQKKAVAEWPRFRGSDGSGYVAGSNGVPVELAWKAAIPLAGNSSPIVCGGRVFVSGGAAKERAVFCFDANTGEQKWRTDITNIASGEVFEGTSYAAPTMAADGERVYVIFTTGELAALDLEGAIVWTKNLGPLKNSYGHASSLAVWQDRVIVQLDQEDGGATRSKLMAFDGASGEMAWAQARPVEASWSTPVVAAAGAKTEIVTTGGQWVIAYEANAGTELWRTILLQNEIVPSPIFAGGMIFVVSPSEKLVALRPDGSVAWTNDNNIPDITTPAADVNSIYTVTSMGVVTCFASTNGAKVWENDLKTEVKASPMIVGRELLVVTADGTAIIAETGAAWKEKRRIKMEDQFTASPAYAQGRLYLRGATNLFCFK